MKLLTVLEKMGFDLTKSVGILAIITYYGGFDSFQLETEYEDKAELRYIQDFYLAHIPEKWSWIKHALHNQKDILSDEESVRKIKELLTPLF